MAELLRHPWILQHSRRPSTPSAHPAASPLHLPLHELAGQAGSPFGELHRASLHGAKSCRDLSALLHAPSAGPAGFVGMLSPAASATHSSLAAATAAVAAADGPAAAARPTTSSSRLAPGAPLGGRPGTPSAARLSGAVATSMAAAAALHPPSSPSLAAAQACTPVATAAATAAEGHLAGSSSVEAASDSQQLRQQHATVQPARATSGHGLTGATATADGSFFSAGSFVSATSTSVSIGEQGLAMQWGVLVDKTAPRKHCLPSPAQPLRLHRPRSSRRRVCPARLLAETSGHSFTRSVAALRELSSSMGVPQPAAGPAPAEPPSGFLVRRPGCRSWAVGWAMPLGCTPVILMDR